MVANTHVVSFPLYLFAVKVIEKHTTGHGMRLSEELTGLRTPALAFPPPKETA